MYTHLTDQELVNQLTLMDNLTMREAELVDRLSARIEAYDEDVEFLESENRTLRNSLDNAQAAVHELQDLLDDAQDSKTKAAT